MKCEIHNIRIPVHASCCPECATSEVEALQAEVRRLQELLYGGRCVYCGEIVGQDTQNQDLSDEVLRQHVEKCEKHPANYWKQRAESAESLLFNPKIRTWAVIEPSDGHIVATHDKREYAEYLVHGNRYLVQLIGIMDSCNKALRGEEE